MALTTEDWILQILSIAALVIYAAVGTIVLRRKVAPEARLANRGFAAWWLGLATLGIVSLPAGFGWNVADAGLTVWRIWLYVLIPVIYVALGGLLYYLLYLYTGRHAIYKPIIGFYVLMLGYLIWLIEGFGPYVASDDAGESIIEYATEAPEWAGAVFSLALVIPILLAAFAYAALYFQVDARESKYRIALVATGIILWFAFSLFNTVSGLGSDDPNSSFAQQAISQSLGLLAACLALIAFVPPAPIRAWLDKGAPQ